MAEAETIGKLISVLGIVFLFVGLLYPGEDTGWTNFQTQTQNFPTFDNPFAGDIYEIPLPIVADSAQAGTEFPASSTDTDAVDDCDTSANPSGATDWWGCLLTQDAGVSYVTTSVAEEEFRVELGGVIGASGSLPILAIKMVTQCRGVSGETQSDFLFYKADETTLVFEIPASQPITCEADAFSNFTFLNNFDTTYPVVSDINNGFLEINPLAPTDFSFVSITVVVGSTKDCSGEDTLNYIGCVIQSFFNAVIKVLRFIVNGIIFIGKIIAYFVLLIVAFFGMVTFFFAIPDAPPLVQGIFTAFIVGSLFIVAIVLLSRLRGVMSPG